MIDMYGLGMSGLPPEHQARFRALQQQQAMAQAMLQQSQDPLANQAPGVAVSPFQGLAKIAQAYIGARGLRDANQAYQGIGEKFSADQAAAIEKVKAGIAPRTLPDASAGAPATMERSPEEIRAALVDAAMSPFQGVRNFATMRDAQLDRREAREDTQLHATQKAALDREQREHERALAAEERLRREKVEAAIRQENFENNKVLKSMIASGMAKPDSVVVQTGEGVFAFDKRSQKLTPLMHNGKQLVGSTSDPSLQGQIAGAKTGGEAVAKREFNMTGLGDTINEAKSILNGDGGALPTGSGVGVARDALAGFVGVSTDGALQAQKLKALSGALTSKMPRMEGPQSDKDVAMYKEMAAEIGNAAVPVERRKAALETVEKLWSKYEPGAKKPPGGAFDASKEQRYQAWKKSQGL